MKLVFSISLFCLILSPIVAESASVKKDIKEGNRFYEQGEYAASKEKYLEALTKSPESDIINFNLGTALYKEQEYESAIDYFQKSFLSEDDELKEKAYYNLGNTFYKLGMVQEKEDVNIAITSLEKSLSQYERALPLNEENENVKHNYEFVKSELERLRLMQQQQQQQQQDQQKQSDDSESQEQKPSQGEESQNSQDQQGQQDQQEKEQEQQQKNQGSGQEDQSEDSEQQNTPSGERSEEEQGQEFQAQSQQVIQLTEEEAEMLLESYQQTEEPQGQLNTQTMTRSPRPVAKDW